MWQKTRRELIDWLVGLGTIGWLGSVLYPILQYVVPPRIPEAKVSSVKLGKVADFPPGTGQIFKFGSQPGILVRTEAGEFRAFSAVCTHLNCTVQYKSDWKLIWCACHNGKYDLNGVNASGPPPRPLQPFKVIVQADEVIVTKEA